jgi:hypothetical protein
MAQLASNHRVGRKEDGPLRPGFRVVVALSFSLTIGLETWTAVTVSADIREMMMASEAFSTVSAFLLGNASALRDYRRRVGIRVRSGEGDEAELLELPSKASVVRRIRIASAGVVLGQAATFVTGLQPPVTAGSTGFVLVALMVTLLCGLAGTYSKPLD